MSKTNSNSTLTRGLKALEEYDMPMSAVFTPLHLPGIGRKTLQTLQEYAIDVGVVHPLVSLVQQLLKDEWEAGANNLPGWHMGENQIEQLTKMLGEYL